MISLEKTGNAIKFTFDDNGHYLQDGTIEVPVNSLTLVTDDSDMFTFKKSATNDIFVSGLYSEIGMTKAELISFYKNNMVDSFINADEAQSLIDSSISGKVSISDNVVSAFSMANAVVGKNYQLSDRFVGPVYVKCTINTASQSNVTAGNITLFDSSGSTRNETLIINISNGQITGSSTSYTYIDVAFENGEAIITPKENCYFKNISYNTYVTYIMFYAKTNYSSGQSANVIENTIYDALGDLNDNILNSVKGVSIAPTVNGLNYRYYTNDGKNRTYDVILTSSTITMDGYVLNTQFKSPNSFQKTLNTGSNIVTTPITTPYYSGATDDVTITFNSGYTGIYTSALYTVQFIDSANTRTISFSLTYDITGNTISYPADFSSYVDVTDTLSTDYKLKLAGKNGWKICIFQASSPSAYIGGVNNTTPNNYISNLVTTSTHIANGQVIIDDIYSKLAALEARLNNS